MKLDALGNEVVIGNRYGIARNTNGITHVVIGRALKETEKGMITIGIEEHRDFVYGNPTEKPIERTSKTVTVLGCNLFPVAEE